MNKKLASVGLLGGIMAIIGVFLPWVSGDFMGSTLSLSGWNLARIGGATGKSFFSPYIVIIGGIISLAGGIGIMGNSKAGYMLPVGGIASLGGCILVLVSMGSLSALSIGFYACLAGALLALIGSLGLRE